MGAEHDDESLETSVQREWAGFEIRLAAEVADLDDEFLILQVLADGEELEGAVPYAQVLVSAAGDLRAEVVSRHHLDERWQLDDAQVESLRGVGWSDPEGEQGNFWWEGQRRDADEVARLVVLALRGVFGCPSPGLLVGLGSLPVPEDVVGPTDDGGEEQGVDERGDVPLDAEHLLSLVEDALSDSTWVTDDETGALLVDVEDSVVQVVIGEQGALTFSVELAVRVPESRQLGIELGLLNQSHPVATFVVRDAAVRAFYVLPVPVLVPAQVRLLVALMGVSARRISDDLIRRCGGVRPGDAPRGLSAVRPADVDLGLPALLELLHDGPVRPAEVAVLFDHDRHLIVTHLVRLRRGVDTPGELPLETVLGALRRGLRHVVGVAVRAVREPDRVPRHGTHQLALLPDPGGELPLAWPDEHSGDGLGRPSD